MDHYSSWLPAQGNPGRRSVVDAGVYAESRSYPEYTNYSPRFSMVYDVRGDGRLAIKASYGKYVGAGSGSGTSNGPARQPGEHERHQDLHVQRLERHASCRFR